jgi:hypothetical protein
LKKKRKERGKLKLLVRRSLKTHWVFEKKGEKKTVKLEVLGF